MVEIKPYTLNTARICGGTSGFMDSTQDTTKCYLEGNGPLIILS